MRSSASHARHGLHFLRCLLDMRPNLRISHSVGLSTLFGRNRSHCFPGHTSAEERIKTSKSQLALRLLCSIDWSPEPHYWHIALRLCVPAALHYMVPQPANHAVHGGRVALPISASLTL